MTVNDVRDLIRLLAEHPEWRAELRPLILSEEVLRLPETVDRIASYQAETSANLARLTERVDQLTERVEQLAIRMDQLTERVDQLAISMNQLTEEFRGFARTTEARFGTVVGQLLEIRFEQRAPSYFGVWLQRPRVVELDELGIDEAVSSGAISEAEYEALASLDLLIRGRDKAERNGRQTVFAVEISNTIDSEDVVQAAERAAILERAGVHARGAVGGAAVTGRANELARERGVYVRLVANPG